MKRLKRVVGVLAPDLGPLRESRDYPWLLSAQAISLFGTAITYVVLPWQMYQLTRSSALVGLLGVAEFVPMLAMAFVGGALADRVDRRRLVLVADTALGLLVVALAINAARPRPSVAVLFLLASLTAGLSAISRPARDAILPRVVRPDQLAAAAALGSLTGNVALTVGPALAGLIVAKWGPAIGFGIDAATYLIAAGLTGLIRPMPRSEQPEPLGFASVTAGLRYARSRQELIGSYLIDLNAMFFGMPLALFPAIAEQFGPGSVGLLYAMPAVGAGLVSLTSRWVGRVRRYGLAITVAAIGWGLAIIGFGLATELSVALVCLAAAGGADCISGIFRMTLWNQTIPDGLRGRMAGIEQVSYLSGPYLGNAEAGLVASAFGVRASVVSGGVLCVIGSVVIGALLPRFIRYRAREGANGPS